MLTMGVPQKNRGGQGNRSVGFRANGNHRHVGASRLETDHAFAGRFNMANGEVEHPRTELVQLSTYPTYLMAISSCSCSVGKHPMQNKGLLNEGLPTPLF